MAKIGYNKLVLMGNLTHDAQRFDTQRGPGCRYAVAATRKVPRTGEMYTDYVPCIHWNSEAVLPYLTKGREVFIEAHIEQRKRELEDGKVMYFAEVVTDMLRLMGERGTGEDMERRELLEYAEQRLTDEQEKLLQDRNTFAEEREQFERAKAAFWQEHSTPKPEPQPEVKPRAKKAPPAKPAAKSKAPVRRGRG